ncbi:hypothetical protein [Paenibacillus mendelii]|uniref:Uncharacterized protein n=1 Tax=Paenibacillus mendelii TaxID=206163 RepID=A0ABV6JCY2_9BACL|nr:hypothetical protein [Paenibacillus mendelii]MCQ6561612.1 hypothetical protein [Paenibacillus mendelii]
MPPYFSVHYSFPFSTYNESFVSEIYNIIFSQFPYKSGYWMSEKNTLEEIISWNTSKLAKKFKLGFDQHVKHDYKQILLESDLFIHLRLYWMYESKEIVLHLILPEDDIFLDDKFLKYDSTKLVPLLNISEKIWDSFEVNTIQTYHELGAPTSYKDVLDGEQPSSEPFSIVSTEDLSRIEKVLNDKFLVRKLNRGFLIIQKENGVQF